MPKANPSPLERVGQIPSVQGVSNGMPFQGGGFVPPTPQQQFRPPVPQGVPFQPVQVSNRPWPPPMPQMMPRPQQPAPAPVKAPAMQQPDPIQQEARRFQPLVDAGAMTQDQALAMARAETVGTSRLPFHVWQRMDRAR